MDEMGTPAASLQLLGGRPSLDFVNTVDWRISDHPREFITGYPDLVAWSRHASLLTGNQAQRLLKEAARRPEDARAALQRAITLREAIYRIFAALSRGRPPEGADLDRFNAELSDLQARSRIAPQAEGFVWCWAGAEDALDRMLWPVVHDVASLLTSEELHRLGQCAGDGCGWLFLDMSRNHSRRWCAMEDCGNRAKARRHYRRSRAQRQHAG